MSFSTVFTRAAVGLSAPEVLIEIHLSSGLPSLSIVGLPEAAVRESKDRVRSALLQSGYDFPPGRITVNLAPADLPKEGGRFDLAIALGILAASGQIPLEDMSEIEFYGELALSGHLRPIRGILTASIAATKAGRALFVPADNAEEATLSTHAKVLSCNHLLDVCAHLHRAKKIPFETPTAWTPQWLPSLDMSDILGQDHAKRSLEIAAAGGHSILFYGPPGTGKTMLASRLSGILPPLTEEEAIEVLSLYSLSKADSSDNLQSLWRMRPFRAPHHTASAPALVGGGSIPQPGEVSLAHHGVLFLDELPEFDRKALEVLREPLESGLVVISRAKSHRQFPARFQLVAAMNPCPCGYLGATQPPCRCTQEQVQRYRQKISGPLLDRLDMQVEVPALKREALLRPPETSSETSLVIRERVVKARAIQLTRTNKANFLLTPKELEKVCLLDEPTRAFLEKAMEKFNLSARAYHRILRVSRTIADLENAQQIEAHHCAEALQYRTFDRGLVLKK